MDETRRSARKGATALLLARHNHPDPRSQLTSRQRLRTVSSVKMRAVEEDPAVTVAAAPAPAAHPAVTTLPATFRRFPSSRTLPTLQLLRHLFSIALAAALLAVPHATQAQGTQSGKTSKPASRQMRAVPTEKIIPLLPKPPQGWTGETPGGSTTANEGFSITTAGCTYRQAEAEDAPAVTVNITDTAGNKQVLDTATAAWSTTSESEEGYAKSITIDGHRGFEQYETNIKTGNLWLMVKDRFLVHVEVTGLPPEELQIWLKRVDLKKLAALK